MSRSQANGSASAKDARLLILMELNALRRWFKQGKLSRLVGLWQEAMLIHGAGRGPMMNIDGIGGC